MLSSGFSQNFKCFDHLLENVQIISKLTEAPMPHTFHSSFSLHTSFCKSSRGDPTRSGQCVREEASFNYPGESPQSQSAHDASHTALHQQPGMLVLS